MNLFTDWLSAWVAFLLILSLIGFGALEIRQTRNQKSITKKDQQPSNNHHQPIGLPHAAAQQKYPTEEEHRSAEQAYWDRHLEARNRVDWIGRIALPFSVLATIGVILSFCETRRQANTADLALVAVQRAYVEPAGVRFDAIKDASGKIVYWNAYLIIQDIGVTPTRLLRAFGTSLSFPRTIAEDPEAGLSDRPMGPQFGQRLGPQEKLTFGPLHIPVSDLADAGPYEIDPENIRLFWGIAEYNDIFPDTPRHVTKFCYRLIADEQAFTDAVDTHGFPEITKSPDVIPCTHHNCTDQECNYDYRIVPDPKAPHPSKPPKWLTPSGK